jgi:hypothetical protein
MHLPEHTIPNQEIGDHIYFFLSARKNSVNKELNSETYAGTYTF